MNRRPTLAHRVEYALLAGASLAGRAAGAGAAQRLGAVLGRIAHRPLGVRRRVVEENLRRAFPERDADWIRATAAAAYAHFGREMMALLRVGARGREDVLARTRVRGLDGVREAVEARRGAIVVTGHIGNWEIGGAAVAARGIPFDVVAQRQGNPLVDRMVVRSRERLGMRVIGRGRAPRLALRALRSGRAVAFVADQNARRGGVFVPFFGRLAATHRGPALFALRSGAPLFAASARRRDDDRYDIRLEEVTVDRSGPVDDAVRRLTAAFTKRLEMAVRAAPDQYFWHHRRWKTRPPEERIGPPNGI